MICRRAPTPTSCRKGATAVSGARPGHPREVLGPDHLDTALSLNNMGMLLKDMGDYEGARPYYERALAIFEVALGPDHPNTRIVHDKRARLSR